MKVGEVNCAFFLCELLSVSLLRILKSYLAKDKSHREMFSYFNRCLTVTCKLIIFHKTNIHTFVFIISLLKFTGKTIQKLTIFRVLCAATNKVKEHVCFNALPTFSVQDEVFMHKQPNTATPTT